MAKTLAPISPSAARYMLFAWQVMMVRSSITAILGEAQRSRAEAATIDLEPESSPIERLASREAEIRILANAGRSVKETLGRVVRHNCAGAAFQILYSLLESLAKSLGFDSVAKIRCGIVTNGEPVSRILWAARNAFAHSDEWKRKGPKHSHAAESYAILNAIGVPDAAAVNLFEVFELAFGGSVDRLVQSVLVAGKNLSEQSPPENNTVPAVKSDSSNSLLVALFSLIAVGITHFYREKDWSDAATQGAVVFQRGSGENAIAMPIAKGDIRNPVKIVEAFRKGAIKRLSTEASRPYRELEARTKAWYAGLDVLLEMAVESPTYHEELLSLCQRADDIYKDLRGLGDPLTVLLAERGIKSVERAQGVMAEILRDEGFTPLPFREVAVDVMGEHGGEQSSRES